MTRTAAAHRRELAAADRPAPSPAMTATIAIDDDILTAIDAWAAAHPNPHEVVLVSLTSGAYTPARIAEAARDGGNIIGRMILGALADGVDAADIVASFEASTGAS